MAKHVVRQSHTLRPVSRAPSLRDVTVGVIGTGKMGQAIIKGLMARGLSRRQLVVADPNHKTRRRVARQFHLHVHSDNLHVLHDADVIIVAVKPQQFPELIAQLAPHLTRRHLIVSIAAGITLRWLQTRLPSVTVIRVMPNLPATVGCGFSAIAAGRHAASRHRMVARAIFEAVGDVVELPERYFDSITAVSGSGPAYVFFLVQMWQEAAQSLGLPPTIAAQAIRATLDGSVALLRASRDPAAILINHVASKGGTTEAALKVLRQRRMTRHFIEALRAAARRSKELSCR